MNKDQLVTHYSDALEVAQKVSDSITDKKEPHLIVRQEMRDFIMRAIFDDILSSNKPSAS